MENIPWNGKQQDEDLIHLPLSQGSLHKADESSESTKYNKVISNCHRTQCHTDLFTLIKKAGNGSVNWEAIVYLIFSDA